MRGLMSDSFFLRVKELRDLADLIEKEGKRIKAEEDFRRANKLKEQSSDKEGTS